jgi:prepilin-type N-terminal cleavage/methylation domain-containing protein
MTEEKMKKVSIKMSGKHGFTLTEVAIVFAIVGSLLSCIWVAYNSVNQNYKTQQATREIMMIAQGIQTKGGWSQFVGSNGSTMINIGMVSPEFVSNSSTLCAQVGQSTPCIKNPWGDPIGIGVVSGSSHFPGITTGIGFIYSQNLTVSKCINLLVNAGNNLANGYGLYLMGVSQDPQGQGTQLMTTSIPTTPSEASNVCNQAMNNSDFSNAAVGFAFNQ